MNVVVNPLVNLIDPNPIVNLGVNSLDTICRRRAHDDRRSRRFTPGFTTREFDGVYETTDLPEHADYESANAFLVEARRSMVT